MIASISRKFVKGVGFSNGCALFTLYQPPPLVKSCLMASKEATPPPGRGMVLTVAFTITATPLVIIGWPLASSLGWDTVKAMLVVRLLPLVSVACTWVVYDSIKL